MYTRNAAFVSYKEDRKGTIEPGKLADFVLLDTDVFRTETEKFKAMLEQGSGSNITILIPSWASYPRTWSPCASVTRRWPI